MSNAPAPGPLPAHLPDATRRGWGAVASVDALASSAGVALLRAGGSAADAAVGASAVLAVTTQHMCGAGGDLVAVVHPGGGAAPRALLAVGRAGSGADAAAMRDEGLTAVPLRDDVRAVTVPGCVDGWLALHAAHGRLPLADVLGPAAELAEGGFPVSPLLAAALPRVAGVEGAQELVGDAPARAGDVRRRPGLGRALREIAQNGRDAWYGGDFGAGLLRVGGGLFAPEDLAADLAEWTEPLQVAVYGGTLHAPGAPTQSHLVLAAARLLALLGGLPRDPDDPLWPHLVVEACRAVGRDRPRSLYDGADLSALLADEELLRRAVVIDPAGADSAQVPTAGGGTVYLCAVDRDGGAVSLSQSNAAGFGSHLAVREVGVFLQNRGLGFSLEPGHPAELAPGRRPPHTLAPVLLTGPDGAVRTVVGTMGGDAQPQVVLQLLERLAAGASPAAAVAAPRVVLAGPHGTGFDTWEADPRGGPPAPALRVEATAPAGWAAGLRSRGHLVEVAPAGGAFGHAQVATRDAGSGVVAAAADPRAGTGDAAVL